MGYKEIEIASRRLPDRLRFRPQLVEEKLIPTMTVQVRRIKRADHPPHVRCARGLQARDRASVQLDLDDTVASCSLDRCGIRDIAVSAPS
jgi:hypothetical protein